MVCRVSTGAFLRDHKAESRVTYQDTTKDGEEALDPSPSTSKTEETTTDRTEGGTKERCSGEEGHSNPPLPLVKHIGDGSSSIGEW